MNEEKPIKPEIVEEDALTQEKVTPKEAPAEKPMDFAGQKVEAIGTPDGKVTISYNASNPFGMTVMATILQTIAKTVGEAQAIALLMSIYSEVVGHRPTVMVYDGKKKIFPPKTVDRHFKE